MIANEEMTDHDEATVPAVRQPKPYARPLAEIMADVSKPIATQHLRQKKKGGATLTYIPWYYAVKYLDYYAPGWCSEVRSITWQNGRIVVTVRLSIPAAEGVVWREAAGTEEEPDEGDKMYGDPSSNAEAMAPEARSFKVRPRVVPLRQEVRVADSGLVAMTGAAERGRGGLPGIALFFYSRHFHCLTS